MIIRVLRLIYVSTYDPYRYGSTCITISACGMASSSRNKNISHSRVIVDFALQFHSLYLNLKSISWQLLRKLLWSTALVEQSTYYTPAWLNNQCIRLNFYLWLRWSLTLHLSPFLHAGNGNSTPPTSARECALHSNSWRARHCNIWVKKMSPNAVNVNRLG